MVGSLGALDRSTAASIMCEKLARWGGLFWMFGILACGSADKQTQSEVALDKTTSILSGEELSRQFCQSCHLYPDPKSLDKNTWERSVLPLMGRRFGIYEENVPRDEVIKGALNRQAVIEQGIFPEHPLLSDKEWAAIVRYYVSNAPDSNEFLIKDERSPGAIDGFEVLKPLKGAASISTTVIRADPDTGLLYIGGSLGRLGILRILDRNFDTVDEIKLPSPPTDIRVGREELAVTLAGSLVLAPENNLFGELIYLLRSPGETKYSSYRKFAGDLSRPVHSLFEDLEGDGQEDIIVAEFGYYTGSLSLFKKSQDNQNMYKKVILKNAPGAIKVCVEDMNRDGIPDIVALFAQGDESISIFYSDGRGGYREETVLRFDPSYGSVYFELVDMNADGHLDILYVNGDNGDYPPILKGYHGIRIFENDGENNYKQVYFYPMHGAFKASAEDFDQDGQLDIFAISYFPNIKAQPRHDLVYLKNRGKYSFSAQVLKNDLPRRWITFEIADIDSDGHKDVLLGSMGIFRSQASPDNDVDENHSLIWLRNLGN